MTSDAIEALTNKLSSTQVVGEGVDFAGKSIKLNNAEDAKVVTDAIAKCKTMEFLKLEGNTLGVEASKAIGNAISSHPELKRALWKDMFTGRMKDEIPQALRFLGNGLDMAQARLVELDLSDNAFGPIGMEGLASLLCSASCHTLQELRLNNNGLGITGAKLLSKALLNCYDGSKLTGKPLPLRVFIAGRNRLENDGITALSKVFQVLGSLEEIQIPQNGIYHVGVRELSEALKSNKGLRVLNLNDNTVGSKGCTSLASALPSLQLLRVLNLGDCLLKTAGAITLAGSLQLRHPNLEELILDHNEIKKDGGLAIVSAMENKTKLRLLSLDGNQFGEDGIELIKAELKIKDAWGSFSEDEGDDDEEEEDEQGTESEEEESGNESEQEDVESENEQNKSNLIISSDDQSLSSKSGNATTSSPEAMMNMLKKVSAKDFLQFPTPERFLALKTNKSDQILKEVKRSEAEGEDYLDSLLSALMKVSSLTTEKYVSKEALDCSNTMYEQLFSWAVTTNNLSIVNNKLLVHVGLLKSEEKKWKPNYNQVGCKLALNHAITQLYFPQSSRDTVLCFLQRKHENIDTITIS